MALAWSILCHCPRIPLTILEPGTPTGDSPLAVSHSLGRQEEDSRNNKLTHLTWAFSTHEDRARGT